MSNKMLVTMKMDQRLQMSQQLRQAITLLQYTTLDLKQLVQQYIDTNPMIEVEESEETLKPEETAEENDPYASSYSADWRHKKAYFEDENTLENITKPKNLRDHLIDQTLLCQFTQEEQLIAEAIIDAIDEQGFLSIFIDEIHSLLNSKQSVSLETMKNVLKTIQTFDPLGVASHNIRECLLIQLKPFYNQGEEFQLAYQIVTDFYQEFCDHDTKGILKNLKITKEQLVKANDVICNLNLYPGAQYSSEMNIYVEPELYVKKIKNTWQVVLADSILTDIQINKRYQAIIRQNKNHSSYQTFKNELDEAKALLTGLKRRNETLLAVASHITALQQEFLEKGLTHMKPMNINEVSSALNLHESTVSRVTTGKYIATPRGVFELKYFFPSYVSTSSGSTCSNIAVQAHIKEIIQSESLEKPYSDAEIVNLLLKKGIKIARRTVAKYREAMKILPSYQRGKVIES